MASGTSTMGGDPFPAAAARRLTVVRDAGQVRDALGARTSAGAPTQAGVQRAASLVCTHQDFFERLAAWALLAEEHIVRDDDVAVWATASALARGDALRPRIAHDVEELRRQLVHGGASAAEVLAALGDEPTGRQDVLRGLFACVADAERRLLALGRVDGPGALRRALVRVERGEVPASLRRFREVALHSFVSPSDVELRLVVGLARAGVPLQVHVPVDSRSRGLAAGVEYVLQALEAAHDAPHLEVVTEDLADAELVTHGHGPEPHALHAFTAALFGHGTAPDAPVEVLLAGHESAEAREVAAVVAGWQRTGARRVAVAVRTIDQSAARIVDALAQHGITASLGRASLLTTAAGRLLVDILAVARDGAPRDKLHAVLTNPAHRSVLSSGDGARLLRVLRRAAARTDIEDAATPRGGYRHRLVRYRDTLEGPEARAEVELVLRDVERTLDVASLLPPRASLPTLLGALAQVATLLLEPGAARGWAGSGSPEVMEMLARARAASDAVAHPGDGEVELGAFATLIERTLARVRSTDRQADHDDHVEVLALPDLFGRRFDHVVVAGMVEGRLPRTDRPERLLGDADRIRVNRAMGRTVLRVTDDNPLEPSPVPRAQATEPLWMVGALRAAYRSVLLAAPRHDGRGRELAPSTFLLEALRVLGQARPAPLRSVRSPSTRDIVVELAARRSVHALSEEEAAAAGVSPALLGHMDRCIAMATQRARFFASLVDDRAKDGSRGEPWAFSVDPARIERVFSSSFGLTPERPLTPTRLEALAACRMHGFVQHVLKVDVDPPAGNTADARVLGTLAHKVMERFFLERRELHVPASRMTANDRRRLQGLLRQEALPLLAGRATGHLGAIRAQIDWLETALVRAVSMLAREPKVEGVEPAEFEVRVGVADEAGGPSMGAVPLHIATSSGPRRLWIGGVIDRVDEGAQARSVVDYKTATTASVRKKVNPSTLFDEHFQLLMYLRLLEHHRPTAEATAMHGYLVSLRDGTTSDDVTRAPELRARILDDARPDGLAAGIGRVVLPILEGLLPPDVGPRCQDCRLRRICRVPGEEGEERLHEGSRADEDGPS